MLIDSGRALSYSELMNESPKVSRQGILWLAVVVGSLWAFSEVVFGAGIRAAGIPFRAGILTGIGAGLCGFALAVSLNPIVLVLVTLTAVLSRLSAAAVLHLPVPCVANSSLAVGLEGLCLAGVMAGIAGRVQRSPYLRFVGAGAAMALAAGVFLFAGMKLAPCAYLSSFNRPNGFGAFMAREGLVWAACSAALFPLGYQLGARFRTRLINLPEQHSALYYTVATVASVVCWGACLAVIAAGL